MSRIALVSLNFAPAHVVQLKAFQNLFNDMGHEATIYLEPEYKELGTDQEVVYTRSVREIVRSSDKVLIENIGMRDILLTLWAKLHAVPVFYRLHEPWDGSARTYDLRGKLLNCAIYAVNALICILSEKVVLPSQNAVNNYTRYMEWCNHDYVYFPLIYRDVFENPEVEKRQYFSYIGGIHIDHGFDDFLRFVEYSVEHELGIRFLLATRGDATPYLTSDVLKRAIDESTLVVHAGKIMSTEEINSYYGMSICVWNAYRRNTQSGVLPYALMLGAPVVYNENGVGKFILHDRHGGYFIHSPTDNEELRSAYEYIRANLREMSQSARAAFSEKYYYGNKKELATEVFFGAKG